MNDLSWTFKATLSEAYIPEDRIYVILLCLHMFCLIYALPSHAFNKVDIIFHCRGEFFQFFFSCSVLSCLLVLDPARANFHPNAFSLLCHPPGIANQTTLKIANKATQSIYRVSELWSGRTRGFLVLSITASISNWFIGIGQHW